MIRGTMTGNEFDALVRDGYAAAGDPKALGTFVNKYASTIGADGAWLLRRGQGRVFPSLEAHTGFDTDWIGRYENYYARVSPCVPRFANAPAGSVLGVGSFISCKEALRGEFYGDFIAPQGFQLAATGVVLLKGLQDWYLVCQWKAKRSVESIFPSVAHHQRLLPHLQTALRVHERLSTLTQQNADLLAALEMHDVAVFCCDTRGVVGFANAAAEAILSRTNDLAVEHSYGAPLAAFGRNFQSAVQRAAQVSDAEVSKAPELVRVGRTNGGHYELLVCPIVERQDALCVHDNRVLVFIEESEAVRRPHHRLLSELYSLTGQEARVASELVCGETPTRISALLNISRETVKSHLKAVYAKTGTTRQAELVSKILRGVVPCRRQ